MTSRQNSVSRNTGTFLLGLGLFVVGLHHLHDPWLKRSAEMATLAHGVETKARITHAEITPEGDSGKTHAISLAWRDGAGRERSGKITVSDDFWRQLMSGNKLVVQETPIKYLEGDISAGALSVIDADASIRQKLDDILWAIPFVVLGLSLSLIAAWQVFRRPSGDGEARSSATGEQKEKGGSRFFDPYQAHWAILVGALGVLLLSWFTYDAWMDYSADKAMLADGVQTKAQIFDAHVNRGKKGAKSYEIGFSWRDGAGQERIVKRLSVSEAFWQKVALGKTLTVYETPIKYLESDSLSRAILLLDADERLDRDLRGIYGGIAGAILMVALTFGIPLLYGRRSIKPAVV